MNSRHIVLGRIRAALAAASPPGPVPRDYGRTGAFPPGSDEAVELLIDRLVDYRATVHRIPPRPGGELASAVAAALGPARTVVVPPGLDRDVRDACAADGRSIVTDDGTLTAHDLDKIDAVVTAATVAIGETGTIVLDGSPDQGRRAITLIPDRHIVVLHAGQVVTRVPEALPLLNPTAPLTMISGPSATSDIELSRVEGVHGPRTLEVVIVG